MDPKCSTILVSLWSLQKDEELSMPHPAGGYDTSSILTANLYSKREPTMLISQTKPDEHPPDATALPMASSHHFTHPG